MSYRINISPDVRKTIPTLPGHIRQRIRKAIQGLAQNPKPPRSRILDFPLEFAEPRRLRLEEWRVIYAVIEDVKVVAVVAVRKRPPYDYTDLSDLFADMFG